MRPGWPQHEIRNQYHSSSTRFYVGGGGWRGIALVCSLLVCTISPASTCWLCSPSAPFETVISPPVWQEWDRQGKPGGSFFSWLSTPEVQLEGCPRHELESDVVHYCRPEERENYALRLHVTPEVTRKKKKKCYRHDGGGAVEME